MARYTGNKFQESVIFDQIAAAANAVRQQNVLAGLGNNVTRNPNYVEPNAPGAPLAIDNQFVDRKPELLTEQDPNGIYDKDGFRLDVGPGQDLGRGLTATPAVLPPGFVPAGPTQTSTFSMPFPGQALSDKQKQSINAASVSEQQRQKMSATWEVIKNQAAREQWTPEQIDYAAMQMQNKAAYQSIVNPVVQAETEEDINDPVVAITRMREAYPELGGFLQLSDKGTIEVIPGIVPMMEALNKRRGGDDKSGVDLSTLKRKAIEGDMQMEQDMILSQYNWPRERPEGGSWIPGRDDSEMQQWEQDRAAVQKELGAMRGRYFGTTPQPAADTAAPAAPASTTQVNPKAAANPRLFAQESGMVFVPDPETGRKLQAEGRLKSGQPMVLPDGRVIPAP